MRLTLAERRRRRLWETTLGTDPTGVGEGREEKEEGGDGEHVEMEGGVVRLRGWVGRRASSNG